MQAAPVRKVSSFYLLARYSVLGLGVAYGFTHSRTLRANAAEKSIEDGYNKKVELIKKAKQAYEKKTRPQTSTGAVNFEDPNFDFDSFDFEAYAKALE